MRRAAAGLTLVELTLVMAITAILAAVTSPLVTQGVQSFVYLPRAQATQQVATEILQTITEGRLSTLSSVAGQPIRGLRLAVRENAQRAIWLAEDSRIGYLLPNDLSTSSDNQYIMIRLDSGQLKRAVLSNPNCAVPANEEVIPYEAAGSVTVMPPSGQPLFAYFDQNGNPIAAPGCGSISTIRRVDITPVVQTGSGQFDQADAKVQITSSAAIRFP